MKKIILFISFVVSFVCSFGQSQQPRSGGSVTATDSNLFIGNSFRVPIFNDTTAANNNRPSLDSSGKVIFTRDRNWFWGRQTTTSRKWIPFDNTSNQLSGGSCGYSNGTHIVTWDSLLTFDVTGGPYVLCCDGIPRATIDGTITLDSNDADFQRIDLIILDSNGVNYIKGEPALNPSTPQTDSCQIILTYVLINAHDSVPAFITPTNPLIIYDENYDGEWINDSTRNVTLDTADIVSPVHLTHDIYVSDHPTGSSNDEFFLTTSTPIDLNDYTVLKYYIKRTTATGSIGLILSWYLGDVQQTFTVSSSFPSAIGYQVFTIPLTRFNIIGGTQVNRLKITITAATNQPFYIDWIQLQGGTIISNEGGSGTVTSVGMNNLDSLLIPSVTNPTTTPVFSFTKFSVPAHTVLINTSDITAPYSWSQIDLSTSVVTGLLPVLNIAPSSTEGDILTTINNQTVWQAADTTADTTFVGNWLVRRLDPDTNNDTLYFGYSMLDTALLTFDTYTSLNGHFWDVTDSSSEFFILNAVYGQEQAQLTPTDGIGTSSLLLHAYPTNYNFQLSTTDGSASVSIGGYSTGAYVVGAAELQINADVVPVLARLETVEIQGLASANNLTLTGGGNSFEITGTTQVNLIDGTNWTFGSVVTLLFQSNVTVKNNQATSVPNYKILLNGGVDFAATQDDTLTLIFSNVNSVPVWREIGRSVN